MVENPREPLPPCNIVLKGGITSGVVYPLTIVELAKKYRFQGIGGTSAGAIAAALTAAAELGRERGGFAKLESVAERLPAILTSLFQPTPPLRSLFELVMGLARARSLPGRLAALAWGLPRHFPGTVLLALLPLAGLGLWGFRSEALALGLVGGLASTLLAAAILLPLAFRRILGRFPAAAFGFCPGIRQAGSSGPGLTDWLTDLLDELAGRPEAPGPLTCGDLAERQIELQCFTTCLSLGRPYVMPWDTKDFFYRPDELRRFFPERVVAWMDAHSQPFEGDPALRSFPEGAELPVIVPVRMSLAFPFLFSTIPLWMRDFTLSDKSKHQTPRRVLFSDGGLSSNLPLQLFDRLWPKMPTFAVTLDRFSEDHHVRPGEPETRVWLPKSAAGGRLLPVEPIESTGQFAGSLIRAMKEWGDRLQSTVPGYRERIVHICLKKEEGGLNLNMPASLIERLVDFGREAGTRLSVDFDWEAHRWTRTLSALDRLAGTLEALDPETIDFVRRRSPKSPYKPDSPSWTGTAADALEALRAIDESRLVPSPAPKPQAQLRIMPRP